MPSPASPEEAIRLATKVWGPPTESLRGGQELRFGRRGSKSLKPFKGIWHDHEAGHGGGIKDLYALAHEPMPSYSASVTYDYCAENGTHLYQVVKLYHPRKFFQRRLDPSAPNGWANNLHGVRRVPYRLPELLAADPSETVWIAEGEKDVENLRRLGLVATTNSEGAGNWHPEFARYLGGRHVVVLPDNDKAGRKHAERVIGSLRGVAASVVELRLPGLDEAGDVSDWIENGGTADDLYSLVEARQANGHDQAPPSYDGCSDPLPEEEPRVAKDKPTLTLFFGEEAALAPDTSDTIVQGIAHRGSLTLLYGAPKSGKSFLATDLALAVADPERELWMSHPVKLRGPVLYTACEGHAGFWKRLQATGHLIPPAFVLATGRPLMISNDAKDGRTFVAHPDDIEAAFEAVKERLGQAPVMVVIDTVFRVFGAGNVNDSAHMMAFVAACQKLAEEGCAVVAVHHANKTNGSPVGSVSLMGAADTILKVERRKDEQTGAITRTWEIEFAKDDGEGEPRTFELQVVDGIVDRNNEPATSCRVRDLGEQPRVSKTDDKPLKPQKERILGPHAATAWQVIRELVAEAGDGAVSIQTCELRARLLQIGVKWPPSWLSRHLSALVSHGDITISGETITIATRTCRL